MRKTILDNIKTGLTSQIGQSSTVYTDLKIEDIQTIIPSTVTVNYFVGITVDRSTTGLAEIGKYAPTTRIYDCNVLIFIKNGDRDLAQTELDTIVNRVLKYFALDTGNLDGAVFTKDGVTESVISFSVDSMDYSVKEQNSSIGAGCSIALSIKTNLTF